MNDTIDILEAIGKDASLRYAEGEALASDAALDAASDALKMAILSGQRGELWAELGAQPMQAMQGVQMPQREEDPDQDEGDEPNPSPDSPDKT